MNSTPPPFRRLHLLQDVGPLDQEILQEQATALGRLGRALERALDDLRAFDATREVKDSIPDVSPELGVQRAALRDKAGAALWEFVIQREACGLRDVRQMLRDYRVPADVQTRMGVITAALPAAHPPAATSAKDRAVPAWNRMVPIGVERHRFFGERALMPRNMLYVLVGAFLVVSIGLAYALYQEKQKSPGVEISVGPKGIAVEKK